MTLEQHGFELSTYTWIFSNKHTVDPFYTWISHLQIQPTTDWKQYFWSEVRNLCMWRANYELLYPNLYKGLETLRILLSTGVLEPIPLRYPGTADFWGVRSFTQISNYMMSLTPHCLKVNCIFKHSIHI